MFNELLEDADRAVSGEYTGSLCGLIERLAEALRRLGDAIDWLQNAPPEGWLDVFDEVE